MLEPLLLIFNEANDKKFIKQVKNIIKYKKHLLKKCNNTFSFIKNVTKEFNYIAEPDCRCVDFNPMTFEEKNENILIAKILFNFNSMNNVPFENDHKVFNENSISTVKLCISRVNDEQLMVTFDRYYTNHCINLMFNKENYLIQKDELYEFLLTVQNKYIFTKNKIKKINEELNKFIIDKRI